MKTRAKRRKRRFSIWIALDDAINQGAGPQEATNAPDQADNAYAAAEIERAQALKVEYIAVLEAIDLELNDLEREYINATDSRRSAISKRRLTLYSKRASSTGRIQALDRKIEQLYPTA